MPVKKLERGSVIIARRWQRTVIHLAAQDLSAERIIIIVRGQLGEVIIIRIGEAGILATEAQGHIAGSTLTVLGNDDLCHAVHVVTVGILIDVVVLRTVDEEHHVGILLDSSRLTEVAKLRNLSFRTLALLYGTIQL